MRIKRLVDAIDTGGDAVSLVAKVRELEARRSAIAGEVASLQPVPRLAPPIVATRLAEWRRLLRQSTTQSRAVLQRVMGGRLTFTPRADGQGYDFTGPTRFDSCSRASSSSGPTSSERETAVAWSTLRPEDTFDGD